MKKINIFFQAWLLVILMANLSWAQDDETRQATGLPMMIGENATNRNKGNLSGKITLEGFDNSQARPSIFVSAIVNGVTVDRRPAADTGNYFIPGIPRENVTIIVEINGQEVGRQLLMSSVMGNIRQDFTINATQWKNAKNKTGVISAKELYQRNTENEKLFEKATVAVKDKKTDEALDLFRQIVAHDPKDFVAWTELATLLFKKGKFSEAEQAYVNALKENIEYMVALINLGKLYLNQKQVNEALLILNKAVEVQPTSADAQHYLGEAFLLAKKGSVAVGYLNEAIKLAPLEKAEVHLRLAALYSGAGLKDKAIGEYNQFLKKVPNHPDKEKIEKYIKENSPR